MLSGISLPFLELREVFNDPLHIFNGFKLSLALFVGEKTLDELVDGISHVSEIAKHDICESLVFITRYNHLSHFFRKAFYVSEIYSIIFDSY